MDRTSPDLTVKEQCALLGLARSTYYYKETGETYENLDLMKRIDELHTSCPFLGRRKLAVMLSTPEKQINPKRVGRLMKLVGLETLYPKPKLSIPADNQRIWPYLLKRVAIEKPNHVWSSDITYIRLRQGFLYLTAVMDWYSRYVLSWEISNTLDAAFCVSALQSALARGKPEIFNSDQGAQYTSEKFTSVLLDEKILISMDGRGRAYDNIFIERLWRSLKYEEVYLNDYGNVMEAVNGIRRWFMFYNHERPHQSLGYRTPWDVYVKERKEPDSTERKVS